MSMNGRNNFPEQFFGVTVPVFFYHRGKPLLPEEFLTAVHRLRDTIRIHNEDIIFFNRN